MLNQLSKEFFTALRIICLLLCGLSLTFSLPIFAEPATQTPPLIENIRELHCASDEPAARSALERLKNNLNLKTGLPDEWEGSQSSRSSIHAGTIDLALSTVINHTTTFPDLTPLAESVIFSWNYCEVFHNGAYFDLSVEHRQIKSTPANYSSPTEWHGFAQLGLGSTTAPRYLPQAFSNIAGTARDKLLYNWWNLQRNQCLPHPASGQIYHQKQYVARAHVNTDRSETSLNYPLDWDKNCAVPFTTAENQWHQESTAKLQKETLERLEKIRTAHSTREWQENSTILYEDKLRETARHTTEKAGTPATVLSPLTKQTAPVALLKPTDDHKPTSATSRADNELRDNRRLNVAAHSTPEPPEEQNFSPAPEPEPEPEPIPDTETSPTPSQVTLTANEAAKNESDIANRYESYKEQLSTPDKKQTEQLLPRLKRAKPKIDIVSEEPPLAAAKPISPTPFPNQVGSIPPFETEAVEKSEPQNNRVFHGLTGSFALSNSRFEKNGGSFTANASYKPVKDSYYFARGGITVVEGDEPVTYHWGLGYNDWHPGTWTFEINNWGPLAPGDGLKVEEAIASISYKFDSVILQKYNLASSATMSGGLNNAATFTLAGSWSPKPNWFIRNLVTQSLEGGATTWAYGFGYQNWRSQTWSLEYNNWGSNTLSSPNFRDNALVTLSWKWNL